MQIKLPKIKIEKLTQKITQINTKYKCTDNKAM